MLEQNFISDIIALNENLVQKILKKEFLYETYQSIIHMLHGGISDSM